MVIWVGAKNGEVLRREFSQKYTVVEPTATVSATMMNVLYADMIIRSVFPFPECRGTSTGKYCEWKRNSESCRKTGILLLIYDYR